MHPYAHCSVTYNRQAMEAAQVLSVDQWVKKWWYIYTMEYYLAIKKNEILTICDNMDGPRWYYVSEISQWETNTI